MINKKLAVLSVVCGVLAMMFIALALHGMSCRNAMSSGDLLVPPGPEALGDSPKDLQRTVRLGLERLEKEDFDQSRCGGKGSGLERCVSDYILVAVNKEAEQTLVYVYQGSRSEPPDYTVALEPGWQRTRVGINVPFAITHPPGQTVVALLTAIKVDGQVREMVYAPYSSSLDTPEMRTAGLRYLESLYDQAASELDTNGVKSMYIDGPATETGDKTHVVSLILTEQVFSDTRFVDGDDKARLDMVNRTLILFAANGPNAYPISRSRVGAVGIAQIMPTTYANLASAYPSALLPQDSDEGRVVHGNAVKAMILHADNQWWALQSNKTYISWLKDHPEDKSFVFAAGYNASMSTVRDAIYSCKANWLDESCKKLPSETRRYITKYRWIRSLLTEASFRHDVEKNAGH